MTDRIYGPEQSGFLKGALAYMGDEPVLPTIACSTISESVCHIVLLLDTIKQAPHCFPHKDLVRALAFIKARDSTRETYAANFDLQFLTLLERDRESTGASHSEILEAYHLLDLLAQECQDAQP